MSTAKWFIVIANFKLKNYYDIQKDDMVLTNDLVNGEMARQEKLQRNQILTLPKYRKTIKYFSFMFFIVR